MALADGSFYYPTAREYDQPEAFGLRYEDVTIPSTDGVRLHGWFFPAPAAVGTVVHCHGNAGNISGHFTFVHWLPACGWNVLCFDYRGYGRSTGRVSRRGTIDDAAAAIRYVGTRPDVAGERVCVFGQSLGGSVAIVALAEGGLEVAGLCIDGAFSSYRAEARFVTRQAWYLWGISPLIARFLISDGLSAIDHAPRLPPIPKLFICGTADRIVDCRQTVALHDAASAPKRLWRIEGGDHTVAVTGDVDGGRQGVLDFFTTCVAAKAREGGAARW